jgi:AcrR family transcriptional regulator
MSKTKGKILQISIELFNRSGVVAVTTNHIAKSLEMSPGNLYFHFRNKEEIIRELFRQMCKETYALWRASRGVRLIHPLTLIEKNFEILWRYRFFHREMYYLRRKDPQLNRAWRAHISKILKLMAFMYRRWTKVGWFKPIQDEEERDFIVNVLLATASSFLHFFESAEKLPAKKHIEEGKRYVARLLIHWTEGQMKEEFRSFMKPF